MAEQSGFARAPGAFYRAGEGTRFCLWAPRPAQVELVIQSATGQRSLPATRDEFGYCEWQDAEAAPGTRYGYRLTNAEGNVAVRPDPASRSQPDGVHGLSAVVAVAPPGEERPAPADRELREYVFYEMHIGTFTGAGDADAAGADLDRLQELGVTALEVMPVAQFPGTRNWGYDGVFPSASQASYGGVAGLTRLVDACHRRGMAAVLDVVYNHLGPEGNYLAEFGPYFTDKYHTPWGSAINFDDADCEPVRAFFVANALYWLTEVGFDALRLDAIHGIFDNSAHPFLAELAAEVERAGERLGRRLYLIAESDLNDVRVLRPAAEGGLGMPAQWSDDLHHSLHTLLTGETAGYYADFGRAADLAVALRDGFVYSGRYSAHRRRRHGNDSRPFAGDRFVVAAQNHDQVGNRARGDRLAALLSPAGLKLAAAVYLLSPNLPLLFMGEEYGETAPFPYFIDHGDPELVEAVRRGRRREFAAFGWDPASLPDPAAATTFESARLHRELRHTAVGGMLESWYRTLLRLRREWLDGAGYGRAEMRVWSHENPPWVLWQRADSFAIAYFGQAAWEGALPWPAGHWVCVLDSADTQWLGPGLTLPDAVKSDGEIAASLSPRSIALYRQSSE